MLARGDPVDHTYPPFPEGLRNEAFVPKYDHEEVKYKKILHFKKKEKIHMKIATLISIDYELLDLAEGIAARDGRTLSQLVEHAIATELDVPLPCEDATHSSGKLDPVPQRVTEPVQLTEQEGIAHSPDTRTKQEE